MEKTKYREDVKYFIEIVGMASNCINDVTLDSKYALIQIPPTHSHSLAITPPIGTNHPTFEKFVFYTNCLAYEHDLPAFICPVKRKALIQPIEKGRNEYINDSFFDSFGMACEAIKSIRLGPLGYVYFRWPGFEREIDLLYTKKYSKVKKELSLYSTALRQIDPLSEFLDYYRVIERISGADGKDWILNNLSRLKSYNFGFLKFGSVVSPRIRKYSRSINAFSVYRRRALARLRKLTRQFAGNRVAEYFYVGNRCGIAHGKRNIKEYDFGYNIEMISKDNYILKLLCRMGIEDKIK